MLAALKIRHYTAAQGRVNRSTMNGSRCRPPVRVDSDWFREIADVADVRRRPSLLADQLDQLFAITYPDARAQIVEQLVHGERLLGRPVGIDQEVQSARQARWQVRAPAHGFFSWRPALRLRARRSAASRASLTRYDSPSMAMTSARCTRRSTSDTTHAAFGNTSDQSLNPLLVVTAVLATPYLR